MIWLPNTVFIRKFGDWWDERTSKVVIQAHDHHLSHNHFLSDNVSYSTPFILNQDNIFCRNVLHKTHYIATVIYTSASTCRNIIYLPKLYIYIYIYIYIFISWKPGWYELRWSCCFVFPFVLFPQCWLIVSTITKEQMFAMFMAKTFLTITDFFEQSISDQKVRTVLIRSIVGLCALNALYTRKNKKRTFNSRDQE